MTRDILEKWQDLSTAYIPPIEKRGFSEHVLKREIWERPQDFGEEETSLLLEPEPEQQAEPEPEPEPKAYIIRMSTNERINIENDGFVIGKSAYADYRIHGNDAISRAHIRVNREGGRFELEDLDSLNKTYVNGEEIHAPVEMEDGQMFKMADEEFCFYIEKEENH